MGDLSDFQVGQTVELQDGQIAAVQFVGQTHFAPGDWVGIVLDTPTGKNDGSVQGQRYFDCQPGHGMFVRPTMPKILDEPTPKASRSIQPKANGHGAKTRTSMAAGPARRQSVIDPARDKKQSISTGSPTPSSRGSQLGRVMQSPTRSPTKQPISNSSSGQSTPLSTTSATASKPSLTGLRGARVSMGPPPSHSSNARNSRQSIGGAMNGSARPSTTASASSRLSSNRLATRPGVKTRLSSISSESHDSVGSGYESAAKSLDNESLSPRMADVPEETSVNGIKPSISQDSLQSQDNDSRKPNSPRARSPPTKLHKAPMTSSAASREVEDLKTKLRVIERKRVEDREKLKVLERVQGERDKFEGIIQKLQTKYQPQQQEIADLRKQLKETDARIEALEKSQAENDTVVEGAALDREMAEETAESLKSELDALKLSHDELRLEVEVLREENQELGKEMSPEEKTSQGWLQMERSNDRLREALMRLRDVTQEQEADFREQIAELEGDLHGLKGVKTQQEQTEAALEESESTIKELREQLESALGSEDMIEELTEKNLALNEQVENLKASIEELESLKELNDELEINHMENAKQMQQEIDNNEVLLAEQARNASIQDQTIQDLDYTVTRFRNLVTSMQTDLEEMRTSQQLTEAEANDLTSRSKAMMDLNLRLQTSATKAQVKAIDLELGKLEAEESAEHLSIIQLFLPESFKSERDSVRAYLRFKRIKYKADLLYDYVRDKVNTQPASAAEDDLLSGCDVMNKLVFVSSACTRFIQSTQSSDLDAFMRLESALFDLEPVERAFNGWIETMKRDELKEDACALELSRTVSLITHLAEVHINDDLEHHADDIYARALVMQGQLESSLLALSHIKNMAERRVAPPNTEEEDEEDVDMQDFNRKAESFISQMRSAKAVATKTIRQLDDMRSRSLTLDRTALVTIERSQASVVDLSDSTYDYGRSISRSLNEESHSDILTARDLSSTLSSTDPSISSLITKVQTATSHLQSLHTLSANLTHVVEFPPSSRHPPWQALAHKLAAEIVTSASLETDLVRLQDEARDRSTALALRDKSLEELNVKLETLEKRAAESGGRRERVRELENVMEAAKGRELQLVATINRLRAERNDLHSQRETSLEKKKAFAGVDGAPADAEKRETVQTTTSEASLARIEALEAEISHQEAAIRHLRSLSHARSLSTERNGFLLAPLIPRHSPQEQRAALRKAEAKSIVSEMLRLATDPANGVVRLRERRKEERLGWRSVRETARWQVEKRECAWGEWEEWVEGLAGRKELGMMSSGQVLPGKLFDIRGVGHVEVVGEEVV
ncbi:MAG: hypothetical protein Q9194_004839 [Teloschistes cf. exilis]